MLPETFWGRIQYLLQQYGASFLSGAGNTMIIAIVGTFLGCLIGFIVGIIQTIPVDKRDSAVKKTLVGFLKFIMACYVEMCIRDSPYIRMAVEILSEKMKYKMHQKNVIEKQNRKTKQKNTYRESKLQVIYHFIEL